MIHDVRRRMWRHYAALRRRSSRAGSASSALASLGNPSRRDIDGWITATAERHDDYRRAHPVPAERVAIVCVSHRVHLLQQVIDNVAAQTHDDVEVVFVANDAGFDLERVESALGRLDRAQLQVAPPTTTLGAALNAAMAATDARYVAKFDDDDLYGPHYIADALRAHTTAGAGVVGKHSYYAHLTDSDRTVMRFPGHEFTYSSTLAGGTLVIDRDIVGEQRFADVSIGEDRAFVAHCHRRGISTYAADRFGFVQTRGADNTWTLPDADFLVGTLPVGQTSDAFR